MFVSDQKPSWFAFLLKVRGSGLSKIWPRIAVVTALSVLTTAVREAYNLSQGSLTSTPFVLIGVPLGIFLGFRNSASYDRFWEGRKLWGSLVNTSRTLTRQILTLAPATAGPTAPPANDDARAWQAVMIRRTMAFAHALRCHLRDQPMGSEVTESLPAAEAEALAVERNAPLAILQRLGEGLATGWRAGWIETFHVPMFDQSLTMLCDIQGACERIKNTPLPFSYNVLIHRIVGLYCLLLPFGVLDALHWTTPVVVAFISYAFFGLDHIGDELEDPFGMDANDLPLSSIARTIEINLRQRLGDPLPEPLTPVDEVLL